MAARKRVKLKIILISATRLTPKRGAVEGVWQNVGVRAWPSRGVLKCSICRFPCLSVCTCVCVCVCLCACAHIFLIFYRNFLLKFHIFRASTRITTIWKEQLNTARGESFAARFRLPLFHSSNHPPCPLPPAGPAFPACHKSLQESHNGCEVLGRNAATLNA